MQEIKWEHKFSVNSLARGQFLAGKYVVRLYRGSPLVTRLIRAYKDEKGAPPALMMQLYEREHARIIDRTAEVKRLQELYRS